uniref:Uncharacterized protein n=1 Tax=Chelonoidis abingdonii TaxID=106734 RepID=A0A8C0IQJ7_CHEAB
RSNGKTDHFRAPFLFPGLPLARRHRHRQPTPWSPFKSVRLECWASVLERPVYQEHRDTTAHVRIPAEMKDGCMPIHRGAPATTHSFASASSQPLPGTTWQFPPICVRSYKEMRIRNSDLLVR